MKLPYLVILTAFIFAQFNAGAQLTTTVLDPSDAVETMLGEGIIVSNITFSGVANQIGSYNSEGTNMGITSGFVMATGDIAVGMGPNNSGSMSLGGGVFGATDPDLDALDGFTHNDAAILEFDFVATGDTVNFRYIWASEEYPEFTIECGSISDVFGFFVSGPGLNGPFENDAVNIALIPETNQFVSINNLNAGCDGLAQVGDSDCYNCEYYIHNGDGFTAPFNGSDTYLQFDGFTVVMTATAVLQCGQTYHIKLAVADVADSAYDSAVFIESDSFTSSGAVTGGVLNPPTINWPSNQVMEDCVDGQFVIFTGDFTTETDSITLSFTGTAQNGVDFELVSDIITVEEGQTTDTLFIVPINDGISEGVETIVVSFPFINACGDLDTASATIQIVDQMPLTLVPINDIVLCGSPTASTNTNGGMAPFVYNWSGGGGNTNSIPIDELGNYSVTVTDYCGQVASESFEVIPPTDVTLEMDDEVFICLNGDTEVTVEMLTGSTPATADWTGSSSNTLTATFDANDAGYQYVEVTDGCGLSAIDSILISIPTPLIGADDLDLCVNVGTGQLAEGGTPPYAYTYDQNAFDPDQELILIPDEAGVYVIDVTDACGQEVEIAVVVSVCDTTIPNVFTPNGDKTNEVFEIDGIVDFPRSELFIYNRWGNLVFESTSYSNNWNGADHPEGVYYYVLKRSDGKNFEGFVHLLRD